MGWRTPDASWLDMDELGQEEAFFVTIVRAEEAEAPKSLMDKEDFKAGRDLKEFKKKEDCSQGLDYHRWASLTQNLIS